MTKLWTGILLFAGGSAFLTLFVMAQWTFWIVWFQTNEWGGILGVLGILSGPFLISEARQSERWNNQHIEDLNHQLEHLVEEYLNDFGRHQEQIEALDKEIDYLRSQIESLGHVDLDERESGIG